MNLKPTSRKATVLIAAGLLTVGTVQVSSAANGDNWILGVLNNTATATTRLVTNFNGSGVILTNTNAGASASALDLRVQPGVPPMKVNSTVKVPQLNSDLLDGFNSTQLMKSSQVRADGNHSSAFLDDYTASGPVATKTLTVPKPGVLLISGALSAEEDCSLPGRGNLVYNLTVDGSAVFGFPSEIGNWAECGVETGNIGGSGATSAVIPVSAGAHTVELIATEWGAGSFITNRSVSAVFAPNGSGDAPGSLQSKPAKGPNAQQAR